eukprot:GGOE01014815.1.p1 GENE.GGOE01014815.1~~GGOE01014815.1.p1  ORF type:complete len:1267 (+),score=318.33 GGOE01014815.1:56-3802(+)
MSQSSDWGGSSEDEEGSESSSPSSSSLSVSPPREPFPKVPEAAMRVIRRQQAGLQLLKQEDEGDLSEPSTPSAAKKGVPASASSPSPPPVCARGDSQDSSASSSSSSFQSPSNAGQLTGTGVTASTKARVPWCPAPVDGFVPDPCPIRRHQTELLCAIRSHQVTIVEGECGGGKSTQVPRMLAEAGFVQPGQALLCVQPHHIACVRLTDWAAHHPTLNNIPGGVYCDTEFSPAVPVDAAIVFCTAFQVLQRLKADPGLADVGCIVVDELQEGELHQEVVLALLRHSLSKSRLKARVILMGTPGSVEAKDWLGIPSGLPESLTIPTKTLPPKEFFMEDAVQWTSFDMAELLQFEGRPVPLLDGEEVAQAHNLCGALYNDATVRSALLIEKTSLPTELLRDLVFLLHSTLAPGAILVFLRDTPAIDELSDSLLLHPVGAELLLCPLHVFTSPSQIRGALYDDSQVRKVILTTRLCEAVINVPNVSFVINAVADGWQQSGGTGDSAPSHATRRASHAGRVQRGVAVHLFRKGSAAPTPAVSQAEEERELQVAALYLLLCGVHTAVGPQPAPGQGLATVKRKVAGALKRTAANSARKRGLNAAIEDLRAGHVLDNDGNVTAFGQLTAALLPLRPPLARIVLSGALFRVVLPAVAVSAGLMVQETLGRLREPDASAGSTRGAVEEDLLAPLRLYAGWWTAEAAAEDPSPGRTVPEALLCVHNVVMRVTQQLQALGVTYDPVLGQQQLLYAAEAQSDASLVLRAALCAAWPSCIVHVTPDQEGCKQTARCLSFDGDATTERRSTPVAELPGGWVLRANFPSSPSSLCQAASTLIPGQLVLLTADDLHYDQNLKFGSWQAETVTSEEALLTMLEMQGLLKPHLTALYGEGVLRPVEEELIDRICEICDEDFDLHDIRATHPAPSPQTPTQEACGAPPVISIEAASADPVALARSAGAGDEEAAPPKRVLLEDDLELPVPKRHSSEGWQCQNIHCLAVNAAHLVECQQCGSHYWDWPCIGCGCMNELRRSTCQKCRLGRTEDQGQAATELLKRSPNFNLMAVKYYAKILSQWLRHEAKDKGLSFGDDGFVPVEEVLRHKVFSGVTLPSLKAIAHRDEKGRFSVMYDSSTNEWRIRANYGHSLPVPLLRLDPVLPEARLVLAHLTTRSSWTHIREEGLRTMGRQYIHFAVQQPDNSFPGAPEKSNVIIFLDVKKCLEDQVPLFHCGAALCVSPGLSGTIAPLYFRTVVERTSRLPLC